MVGKIIFCFLSAALSCTLFASEVSEKKIKTITEIVIWEYKKVASPARPAKSWQIYKNVNDPKIKASIYNQVSKKAAPFETKAKLAAISPQANREIALKVNKRFPYKNAGEIAMGAVAEAERTFPLVKKGDDVTIRYYRGGVPAKVSGIVQSVRGGGSSYEVGNQLVQLSEIRESDRKYFDPDLNESLRRDFINKFQANWQKIKENYRKELIAEELKKVTANEKNGYIFFQNKWVTAKFVTDQLIKYYLGVTQKRLKIEAEHFVQGRKAAPKKK